MVIMTPNYYSICDVKRVIIEHALTAVAYEQTATAIDADIIDPSIDENGHIADSRFTWGLGDYRTAADDTWKYIAELVNDYGIEDEFLDGIGDRYDWDINVLDRVNAYRSA